jgi:hypothetical protein
MVYLSFTEKGTGGGKGHDVYEVFRGSTKISELAKTATGCEIRPEPTQYATPEEVQAMRAFISGSDFGRA